MHKIVIEYHNNVWIAVSDGEVFGVGHNAIEALKDLERTEVGNKFCEILQSAEKRRNGGQS